MVIFHNFNVQKKMESTYSYLLIVLVVGGNQIDQNGEKDFTVTEKQLAADLLSAAEKEINDVATSQVSAA